VNAARACLQYHRPAAVRQFAAAPGISCSRAYSIGTAMSMAVSGARGDTASEMMRVLSMRYVGGSDDMANAEVLSILNGYDHSTAPPVCPAGRDARRAQLRDAGWRRHDEPVSIRLAAARRSLRRRRHDPPSARLLAANALMLISARPHIPGLYRGAQDQVRRRSVRGYEPGRRQRLGCPQDGGPDSQAAGSTRSQFLGGPPRRRIISGALGIGVDKKLTRRGASISRGREQAQVPLMSQTGRFRSSRAAAIGRPAELPNPRTRPRHPCCRTTSRAPGRLRGVSARTS